MIPARLLPLTVIWQQPGTATEGYSDVVDDWSDEARTDTEIAAYIEQQNTNEMVDGRNTVSSRLLFVTNELGVKAQHRIKWGDDVYAVDGDCAIFHTPNGPHHAEATLLLVTG